MGTGHYAAVSAGVHAGGTVAIVGDGAVGICGVLAARRLGAERIIPLGHQESRLSLGRRFGATDLVTSRGEQAEREVIELTGGGAESVLECVGTKEAMDTAVAIARPGGSIGYVGVPLPTILEGRVTDERAVPPGELINHGVRDMPRPITIRSLETVTRGTGEVNISGNIWRILAFGQSRVGRKASRERATRPRAVWYSEQVQTVRPSNTPMATIFMRNNARFDTDQTSTASRR